MNKHLFDINPFDIIDERLHNHYYDELPLFSYSKDIAATGYLLGYCSKIDYNLVKFKYEFSNNCGERKGLVRMMNY